MGSRNGTMEDRLLDPSCLLYFGTLIRKSNIEGGGAISKLAVNMIDNYLGYASVI